MSKTENILVWITPEIKELINRVAEAQGLNISEYIRSLVTADLDKRTFFTTQIKEELAKSDRK